MKHLRYFLAISIGVFLFSNTINAQCKRFTEKQCLPKLAPFTNNGQINNATLFEGDSASLIMTFYSLLDYRLIVCSHDVLGAGAHFKVRDNDGNILFNSQEAQKSSWDFRVNSTQDLMVSVIAPKNPENLTDIPASGCVSIILGFRE
mgnify:FL=1|jgi:hypothetical protein|tara:strand:+ start:2206 stop:2646 length:441 start_codon:yes stop_codon:yes gene_type:complete